MLLLTWKKDTQIQFTSVVLCHSPPLPGLLDHALLVLNHDRTDRNTLVHSNSSVIQLLLYDVITTLANYKVAALWNLEIIVIGLVVCKMVPQQLSYHK